MQQARTGKVAMPVLQEIELRETHDTRPPWTMSNRAQEMTMQAVMSCLLFNTKCGNTSSVKQKYEADSLQALGGCTLPQRCIQKIP